MSVSPYYERDGVRLFLGDCRDVLPTLEHADSIVTDPPYGIGFKYNTHDDEREAYPELIQALVNESNRLVTSGYVFVWQAMKNCRLWSEWFPSNYRIFAALKNFCQFQPTAVQYSWDPVIFWCNGTPATTPVAGMRDYHMGNTARWISESSNGHPCPRPVDTVQYVVDLAVEPGALVVDPFFGSGTTGEACVRSGCRVIGIELDEQYIEIAAKRLDRILSEPRLPFVEERPEVQTGLWDE